MVEAATTTASEGSNGISYKAAKERSYTPGRKTTFKRLDMQDETKDNKDQDDCSPMRGAGAASVMSCPDNDDDSDSDGSAPDNDRDAVIEKPYPADMPPR